MSEPVVLLNKDKLSLQFGTQKCSQVVLERDSKLGLALQYNSPTDFNTVVRRRVRMRRKRRTLAYPFNQVRRKKSSLLGKTRQWTSASCQDGSEQAAIMSAQSTKNISAQDGCEQAALLVSESKPPSTDVSELGGCEQAAVLGMESKTPLTNISKQDGGEDVSILGMEMEQSSTTNILDQKECVHALPLNPLSGRTSNFPGRNGSDLTTSSNKPSPSCISDICQDTSISKEDFMALHCLSSANLVARARTCNHYIISKGLHIKSHNIWRRICGDKNIPYSGQVAKAVLRSFKVKVLLQRSNFIDCLALQSVPQSINTKNLKIPRPQVHKAAYHRKMCKQVPSSVSVVLKRDSDLDRLAQQISNATFTTCSPNPPRKRPVNPSKEKCTSTASLSTDTTSSLALEYPSCKWLSVNIKRDSGLDVLARQTSDSMCKSLPSSYPGMSIVTPSKIKNPSKAPLSTDTTSSLGTENPSSKWLSVDIMRDSGLDVLARQTSDSACKFLSSNSSGTCITSPSEVKRTSAVKVSTDSTIRDSGSGLAMLSRQTFNPLFDSRSSNSPGISMINSSDAKFVSTVPLPTSAVHVMENPVLKHLFIKINRDLCIDQLAFQTSNTTVTGSDSHCHDSSVSRHLTPKVPLGSSISPLINVSRNGMNNSINHEGKLGLLPNLEVSKDSKILGQRTVVIKLRRLMSDDWSIVQPDEPASESSGSESDAAESTDSKNAAAELTSNLCVGRLARLPTSRSRASECGCYHKTRSRGSHCANQQNPSAGPSEQTEVGPFFHCSAGRSFQDTPTTVPSVSCSNSPKRRTRSALHMEKPPIKWHYNENENPQKHDIPLAESVNIIVKHSSGRVEKYQVSKKSSDKTLGNDLLEEPCTKAKAACLRDRPHNLMKPSISSYMSVKKPLGVKSPNHEPTC